jgi:hypothetical protein
MRRSEVLLNEKVTMSKLSLQSVINLTFLMITLGVNFLSQAIPLNGQTSAEIANRLPILFVPDNYVFGIWGIIYTLLIGFGIYQALPAQRDNPLVSRIGNWFVVTCIANATWLVLFHYNLFALSMVAMVVLLIALIIIYTRLEIGKRAVSNAQRWFLHIPFSVYLGWITVATVANAAYVLYDAQWDGFGISGAIWATLMLVIATSITLMVIFTRRDIAYSAVIIWALIGIVSKQAGTPLVAATAAIMTGVIVVAFILTWFTNQRKQIPNRKLATSSS